MDTLLLVEDDRFIRHYIREKLEEHDILTLEAMSGKRAIEILGQHPVDIILLDLVLPDGNGLDLIPAIREQSNVPLIIVSGSTDTKSRITSLERGADDFIAKPFVVKELLARIQASLRRYRSPSAPASPSHGNIRFARWTMDVAKMQIFDESGLSAELTTREFSVFKTLAENAGIVLTRDELCQTLKQNNYVPTPRAIDVKIARIRKKLGENAHDPRIIKTLHGAGYMFNKDQLLED